MCESLTEACYKCYGHEELFWFDTLGLLETRYKSSDKKESIKQHLQWAQRARRIGKDTYLEFSHMHRLGFSSLYLRHCPMRPLWRAARARMGQS